MGGGGIGGRQDEKWRNEKQMNRKENVVDTLEGKKVAIVVANGFEQVEMTDPKRALEEAGSSSNE